MKHPIHKTCKIHLLSKEVSEPWEAEFSDLWRSKKAAGRTCMCVTAGRLHALPASCLLVHEFREER